MSFASSFAPLRLCAKLFFHFIADTAPPASATTRQHRKARADAPDPYRIAWGKIKVGLNTVRADVEAEKTPALEWELWLRKKVIGRIPGA